MRSTVSLRLWAAALALPLVLALAATAQANNLRPPRPVQPPAMVEPPVAEPSVPESPVQATAPAAVPEPAPKPALNIGDLLGKVNAPVAETPPAPPREKPAKTASTTAKGEMVLPKQDRLDFLEGAWRCDSGLVRMDNGDPIVLEFSFDKKGNGTSWIREKDGTVYRTKVRASIRNQVLSVIPQGNYTHPKRRNGYNSSNITCRQVDGRALCAGKNRNTSWTEVPFTKVR